MTTISLDGARRDRLGGLWDRLSPAYGPLGAAIAREARYVGVNWVLNPVVDLNYTPRNPITNTRSKGDHPARVCRLAPVWSKALQTHGVAATAKHFPGDGMDDRD